MTPTVSLTLVAAWLSAQPAPGRSSPEEHVTLPLTAWSTLVDSATPPMTLARPPLPVVHAERTITGAFDKGLLEATLEARFEVYDDQGYLQVPVLDDSASPGAVTLNGQPTSLVAQDGMYTVGVEKPGIYSVRVTFFRGQEQDRFARRLQLRLPAGGITEVSVLVPEHDIAPRLAGGVITRTVPEGPGTRVVGYLDASGQLDLAWSRTVGHKGDADVKTQATVRTIATVDEGLVRGVSVVDVTVTAGETDKIDLALPPGVEVLDVSGPAVLQWRPNLADRSRLEVLLRYLVADRARVVVRFQTPVVAPESVELATILAAPGVPMTGVLGVQAPAGLDVTVKDVTGAQAASLRELPSDLTALTNKPLLYGFRFTEPPRITLSVAHHEQVPLTSTLIDELQASTVLLADGSRVTKMRLDIRNNTRQYLAVTLPPGAEMTHALLDGQTVRPAAPTDAKSKALLFSLRQSERIDPDSGRVHVVQRNESLGSIAHYYYADPSKWTLILDANQERLRGSTVIQVGQTLAIPTDGPLTVEESAFVLELAYREPGQGALGLLGREDMALPDFDVDAMKVVWHLYLPEDLEPLDFDTALTSYDARRYGLLRRVGDFLDVVFGTSEAQAGGGYESILQRRKVIYREEVEKKDLAEVAPATFPLVGVRYRFKRVLGDGAAPRVSVTYLDATAGDLARALAFALMFALTVLALRRRGRWWEKLVVAAGVVGLMVAAHYVLGVHRLMVWAAIAGTALAIFRVRDLRRPGALQAVLDAPWRLLELATLGNLVRAVLLLVAARAILGWPPLRPFVLLLVLLVWWRLWARRDGFTAPPALPPTAPEVPTHA
ncbi:MAG: LysM peptidoglycan-binding domain-containing protein [Deltaproteobacteria bacterium]|nr:MAG: LysM peptidoglycan-binding domain-containing protein [Deltaproteobacteria bacterium]